MYLAEELKHLRFEDWNHTVRGLVELWEVAREMGLERDLEEMLWEDQGGRLTQSLGRIGNECGLHTAHVSRRAVAQTRWRELEALIGARDSDPRVLERLIGKSALAEIA